MNLSIFQSIVYRVLLWEKSEVYRFIPDAFPLVTLQKVALLVLPQAEIVLSQ
jgi:hypothetical protein